MDQLNPSFDGTVHERDETDPRCIGCGDITDAPDTLCQSCRDSFEHSINSPQVCSPNVDGGQPDDDDPMSADPRCIGCGNVTDAPNTLCLSCREVFEHTVNSPDVHSPYVGGQHDDNPMSADPRCIGCGNGTDTPNTLCQSCREIFERTVNSPDVRVHSLIVEGGQSDDDAMSEDGPDTFTFWQTGQRTFAKNAATQTTYKLNLHPDWENKRLEDILEDLHDVFREIIARVKSVSNKNTDLAYVIIHVPEFGDIVVPLRPLNRLTVDDVMKAVENALQSNQNLEVQNGFQVTIGIICIPTGAGRNKGPIKCYTLSGPENATDLKRSVITVTNDDNSCMYQAIAISWIKSLRAVSQNKWEELNEGYDLEDPEIKFRRMLELEACSNKTTHLISNTQRTSLRKQAAGYLCREAGMNYDTPGTLTDLLTFEAVIERKIVVVSNYGGNQIIRAGDGDMTPISLYLKDAEENRVGHFHAITSIAAFLGRRNFCYDCMKPYTMSHQNCIAKKQRKECRTCGREDCVEQMPVNCPLCNLTFKNPYCYRKHLEQGPDSDKKKKTPVVSWCQSHFKCEKVRNCL